MLFNKGCYILFAVLLDKLIEISFNCQKAGRKITNSIYLLARVEKTKKTLAVPVAIYIALDFILLKDKYNIYRAEPIDTGFRLAENI